MKISLALLLSVIGLLAAEDVHVTTVLINKTNASGSVTTKQYFTRGGQTNLLCNTTRTNGVVKTRLHRFYYRGRLVADHMVVPVTGYSFVTTFGGYSLRFTWETNALVDAFLSDQRDDKLLDAFTGTNGVLVPVPTSEFRKMTNDFDAILREIQQEIEKDK